MQNTLVLQKSTMFDTSEKIVAEKAIVGLQKNLASVRSMVKLSFRGPASPGESGGREGSRDGPGGDACRLMLLADNTTCLAIRSGLYSPEGIPNCSREKVCEICGGGCEPVKCSTKIDTLSQLNSHSEHVDVRTQICGAYCARHVIPSDKMQEMVEGLGKLGCTEADIAGMCPCHPVDCESEEARLCVDGCSDCVACIGEKDDSPHCRHCGEGECAKCFPFAACMSPAGGGERAEERVRNLEMRVWNLEKTACHNQCFESSCTISCKSCIDSCHGDEACYRTCHDCSADCGHCHASCDGQEDTREGGGCEGYENCPTGWRCERPTDAMGKCEPCNGQDDCNSGVDRPADTCSMCPGECIVDGHCHSHTPEGAPATEGLCADHSGVWCPEHRPASPGADAFSSRSPSMVPPVNSPGSPSAVADAFNSLIPSMVPSVGMPGSPSAAADAFSSLSPSSSLTPPVRTTTLVPTTPPVRTTTRSPFSSSP